MTPVVWLEGAIADLDHILAHELVVRKVPILLLYELVDHAEGPRMEIFAVFNTRRDPKRKPRHRR